MLIKESFKNNMFIAYTHVKKHKYNKNQETHEQYVKYKHIDIMKQQEKPNLYIYYYKYSFLKA